MAKRGRKGASLARRSGGRIRRANRGASKPTIGLLPAVAGVGVIGVLVANDFVGAGNSAIGFLTQGNWQGAIYVISKNFMNTGVIAALIPMIIVLAVLVWLHKKMGGKTRFSKHLSWI
jgi:hypothetical protein